MKFARVPGSLSGCLHVLTPPIFWLQACLSHGSEDEDYRMLSYRFSGIFVRLLVWRLPLVYVSCTKSTALYWCKGIYLHVAETYCKHHGLLYLVLLIAKVWSSST